MYKASKLDFSILPALHIYFHSNVSNAVITSNCSRDRGIASL